MSRKPQSNAVLKTLPEERQAEIFSRLTTKTTAWPDTSLEAVRGWLADDGVKTSTAALSEFHSWYSLSRQLERNGSVVEMLIEVAKQADPEITPEEIQRFGQAFFSALALQQQDPKGWFLTQQTELKKQSLEDERAKFTESKKDGQVKALEGCLEESKQFPAVQELFRAAFAALKKAKAGRK
jgi:hypothetical protein